MVLKGFLMNYMSRQILYTGMRLNTPHPNCTRGYDPNTGDRSSRRIGIASSGPILQHRVYGNDQIRCLVCTLLLLTVMYDECYRHAMCE